MTYGQAYSDRYLETAVLTATPEQLVVMLYEGAIRYLSQAMVCIEVRDYERKRVAVDLALGIVEHLQTSLDMRKGGAISGELRKLYKYIGAKILQGSIELKTEPLDEAVKLLSTLLESWRQVASRKQASRIMSAEAVGVLVG